MSVGLNSVCMGCHFQKCMNLAHQLGDEETATAFAKDLFRLYLSQDSTSSSPMLSTDTNALLKKYYGLEGDRFQKEKDESNRFVMERLAHIRSIITGAENPVKAGLQFAILGNYIDYSALQGEVSFQALDEMLKNALHMDLEEDTFRSLCRDLETGKNLLYVTDNAGEIGFDRLFAEELQKAYPQLTITFLVRGGFANNDATREDAAIVGLPFPVLDNGTTIPGTCISRISPEAKAAFDAADVIIAKGQGNVETMLGCGYNVYYAFLVKCVRFIEMFQKPKLTPMLLKEKQ